MKHQTGGTGWPTGITYLTFVPDCRRSGVRIPAGKKPGKKRPQYMHYFGKFRHSFVIFGTNLPDNLLPQNIIDII